MGTALGQLLFKMYYINGRTGYVIFAVGMFVTVPVFSYLALANLSLAIVYMSTALTHVLVVVMSRIVLHEMLSRRRIVAGGLIVLGVVLFNVKV